MIDGVIDRLESIEINVNYCKAAVVALAYLAALNKSVFEQGSVRQTGKGIVARVEAEFIRVPLLLADIIQDPNKMSRLTRFAENR